MKQKDRWAKDHCKAEEGRESPVGEPCGCPVSKAWIAGFEKAKSEIVKFVEWQYFDLIKGLGEDTIPNRNDSK